MSTNNTPLPDTASGADLYVSRHDHPYDRTDPCLELSRANNSVLRGRCLIQAELAAKTAQQIPPRDHEEHFTDCPCGRCQQIRAERKPLALVPAQKACTCRSAQTTAAA